MITMMLLPVFVEISDSQQQIQGINRQYDQLGESLSDHQRELQFMMLGVTSFNEDFERILLWLHCTEQQVNERDDDHDETRLVRQCSVAVVCELSSFNQSFNHSINQLINQSVNIFNLLSETDDSQLSLLDEVRK